MQGIFGGNKRTKAVLQRLDRLTIKEDRTTATDILKVVYGLVQDMSKHLTTLAFHWPLSTLPARWQSI